MGVRPYQTWPVVFARLAAARVGIPIEQSHVQNFAQIGASNNYVSRTLIRQCDRVQPTLAIAAFTHNNRVEYLDGSNIRNLGYWNVDPSNRYPEPPDSPGARFFRQYSEREGFRNLLRNMLFFQSAMLARGVPYIIVWIDVGRLRADFASSRPLGDYYRALDQSRISRISMLQHGIHSDTVDGHPGPLSHERFAACLLEEFRDRLLTISAKTADEHGFSRCAESCDGDSADRLARNAIRIGSGRRPRTVSLAFPDSLAVERFAGERIVRLDLERGGWRLSALRLRAAYADYVTADLLRFELLVSVLIAQEFLRSVGIGLKGTLPDDWIPARGQASPILDELVELLDLEALVPRPAGARGGQRFEFAERLDRAKRRLQSSRREALLRHLTDPVGKRGPAGREDSNLYPLW